MRSHLLSILGVRNMAGKSIIGRGGRPLCALYPEQNAFTVLIVLGAKETAQAVENLEIFHPNIRACLEDTPPFMTAAGCGSASRGSRMWKILRNC